MIKCIFPVASIVLFLSCGKKNDTIIPEKKSNEIVWNKSITWTQCPTQSKEEIEQNEIDSSSNFLSTILFECGTFKVPLDWNDLTGKTIDLALKRAKATQQNEKIGSLIVNPGGPGGSGVYFVNGVINANSELIKKFDIVGFDPRGVHASTPIKCKSFLDNSIFSLLNSEQNFFKFQNQVRNLRKFCAQGNDELINYVNTENVVKDLEAIRVALGNEKLNYYGVSYGTSIGATYAYRYPNNTRAMVLDGVVDQSKSLTEIVKNETMAIKNSFNEFAKYCNATFDCNLNFDEIVTILEQLSEEYPLLNDAEIKKITKADILTSLTYSVTEFSNWKKIGHLLLKLNKLKPVLNADDFLSSEDLDETMQFYAVECLDYPMNNFTWNDYLALKAESKKIFPAIDGFILSINTYAVCSAWENKRHEPLQKNHNIHKEQPILLVSSLFDAITPHANALLKLQQIQGSKLLQSLDNTHSVSLIPESTCVQNYVNQFFTTVTLPADFLLCDIK